MTGDAGFDTSTTRSLDGVSATKTYPLPAATSMATPPVASPPTSWGAAGLETSMTAARHRRPRRRRGLPRRRPPWRIPGYRRSPRGCGAEGFAISKSWSPASSCATQASDPSIAIPSARPVVGALPKRPACRGPRGRRAGARPLRRPRPRSSRRSPVHRGAGQVRGPEDRGIRGVLEIDHRETAPLVCHAR